MVDRTFLLGTLEALEEYGVDASEERRLLEGGSSGGVLLIAGAQGARVFDLMRGLDIEPPVWEGAAPPFPVLCGYGEQFSIRARDRAGEKYVFFSTDDFCRYFAGRQEEVRSCRITAPAPVLRGTQMRFLELGQGTADRLPELAADCAGYLLALPCAAGAPGEDMERLCRWVREVRALPDRTGVVFNHAQARMVNTMPAIVLNEWLGVKAPCWKCGYTAPGKHMLPGDVLKAAAEQLAAGETGAADGQMAAHCARRAAEKALDRKNALDREAGEHRRAAQWMDSLDRNFRAGAENTGASLRCSLTAKQEKDLREDIAGMTQLLCQLLPDMIQEVVEQNGKEAKADLKNLAGDYLETVLNSYIAALVERIGREEWFPQVQRTFQEAVDSFRLLVKDAPIAPEDHNGQEEGAYLKMLNVNLGNYVNDLALGAGGVVSVAVSAAVRRILKTVPEYGILLILLDVPQAAGKAAGKLTALTVDAGMPPKMYGKTMAKQLQKIIVKTGDTLLDTMKDSLLPVMNEHVARQYQEMIDGVCASLLGKAETHREEARCLERQAQSLERQRLALLAAAD